MREDVLKAKIEEQWSTPSKSIALIIDALKDAMSAFDAEGATVVLGIALPDPLTRREERKFFLVGSDTSVRGLASMVLEKADTDYPAEPFDEFDIEEGRNR